MIDILKHGLLYRPELVFRPTQIFRCLFGPSRKVIAQTIRLPWGASIHIEDTTEYVGRCICRRGLYELVVCEALWRLTDRGELAVDVGSNIGQMASILALRAGSKGVVLAFEPHPKVFANLARNINQWSSSETYAKVSGMQSALSDRTGHGYLTLPKDFESNHGLARLESNGGAEYDAGSIRVEMRRLDDIIPDKSIGVVKIDTEGHEFEVLKGSERLLKDRRIRDIVFEGPTVYPSPVTDLLESYAYKVFTLGGRFWGPHVVRAGDKSVSMRVSNYEPTYLATASPERALSRLGKVGWKCMKYGSDNI